MKRIPVIVLVGLVSLAMSACSGSDKPTTIAVSVRVNVCVPANDCHVLPVPDAEVVVNAADGRVLATGRTEQDGVAHLTVTEAGEATVVAKTPLWKEKEKSSQLMVVAGSDHSLTMWGALAETAAR